jgi:serine/threonine protein kinase
MEKLILKGNTVLWIIDDRKWLVNFLELTTAWLTEIHPHTRTRLKKETLTKISTILNRVAGHFWIQKLQKIKKYKNLSNTNFSKVNQSTELGKGKYGAVYNYDSNAVKIVKHCEYKSVPKTTGKFEAQILKLLTKNLFDLQCPGIVTMYQFQTIGKTDYIVFEKLDQTVWKYLKTNPCEKLVKCILLQVLFTLAVLQKLYPGFRHNDLKVDNILLDQESRSQSLTLRYDRSFWKVPKEAPLVKLADFDYANIPKSCPNPKVDTSFSKEFGCTPQASNIYDVHLFLNSMYSSKKYLPSGIVSWIGKKLPPMTRGSESSALKYSRLMKPNQWKKVFPEPIELLREPFFGDFLTSKPNFPIWGIS